MLMDDKIQRREILLLLKNQKQQRFANYNNVLCLKKRKDGIIWWMILNSKMRNAKI